MINNDRIIAIFFGEPLVCEKARLCEIGQMLMRLHS